MGIQFPSQTLPDYNFLHTNVLDIYHDIEHSIVEKREKRSKDVSLARVPKYHVYPLSSLRGH